MLKIYQVYGTRHQAVVFAETPEDAVACVLERKLIGAREMPKAVEVPLPKGYQIIYNPVLASMEQAELPLLVDGPPPEPPYTVTPSGVKVYDDWRDNIVVDADAPAVTWKAGRDTFGRNTYVPGVSRLAGENSIDALSWNLFRTLEKVGRLDAIIRALGLDDEFQVLYWHRPWDSADPPPEIRQALDQVEPWRKAGGSFQTEADVILVGRRYLVILDGALGKPGAQIRPWERGRSSPVPAMYETQLRPLLADMADWQGTMQRFYRLLRHLIFGNALCQPGRWDLEYHLLAVVNQLNRHALRPHEQEFAHFQRALRLPPERTHLVTWQAALARAKATFDPGVRPLLDHAAQLGAFQPPEPVR